MKNVFKLLLLGLLLASLTSSCAYKRIDAAHVGIRVNKYGTEKGVDDVTEVTGAFWYNTIKTDIYETPTFVQNVVWTGDRREGSKDDQRIWVTSKDGLPVGLDISLNYLVKNTNAVEIFVKYRKPLEEISNTILRNYIRDGYNTAAASYTAEALYDQRLEFESLADSLCRNILEAEGFTVENIVLVSNIQLPPSITKSIEAKVEAKQTALRKESELQATNADADKVIAAARGVAEAKRIDADAEAYAYQKKQRSLTQEILQQQFIDKWNGEYGTGNVFGQGPILYKNIK